MTNTATLNTSEREEEERGGREEEEEGMEMKNTKGSRGGGVEGEMMERW